MVLIHGGGPQIESMCKRLFLESMVTNGQRVSDHSTLEVVQLVLCGFINKNLCAVLNKDSNRNFRIGRWADQGSQNQQSKFGLRWDADNSKH